MSLFDCFFYLFAAAIVASAGLVCFSRNIVHAAFALLVTFFGVAGIYVLLSADFLAVSQILIYVGGILVLLVFGVMLTNRVTNIDLRSALSARIPAFIICGALLVLLISFMVSAHWITFKDMPWAKSPWNHDAISQVTQTTQGTTSEILKHEGSQGDVRRNWEASDDGLPFAIRSCIGDFIGGAYRRGDDGAARPRITEGGDCMNIAPVGLPHFLVLSAILLVLGIFTMLTRRNAIAVLMGIELILNAANINFVAFTRYGAINLGGQVIAIFVIVMAASEAAVALAIVLNLYKRQGSVNVREANKLRD